MINKRKKSLIAPTALVEKNNYYIIGERYTRNYLVTALPNEFGLGMLSYYTSNPNIKVFYKVSSLTGDLFGSLNSEYRDKEQKWRKTKDPVLRERLEKDLVSLNEYIQEMVANNERALNLVLIFSISTNTLDELNSLSLDLKSDLKSQGFKVEAVFNQQVNLFKWVTGLWIDTDISDALKYNIGIPITPYSLAGMWPYTFQYLKDDKGFLLGSEMNNAGIVLFDPQLYINNIEKSIQENRLNGNIVVFGGTGAGKTTTMNLFVRYGIRNKINIITVDPENKNAYFTKTYGGNYIQWGAKGNQINIFDLKPISVEEGEEDVEQYDVEIAIFNVIDDFEQLMKLYKPHIDPKTLNVAGSIIIEMFNQKGFKNHKTFKHLKNEDYPIVDDFFTVGESIIEKNQDDPSQIEFIKRVRDLLEEIDSMRNQHKYYFNGHTTIRENESERSILSFGSKILFTKSLELRNALNFLMFSYIKAICLNYEVASMTLFDEAHLYLLEGRSAEEIAIIQRRSRKYRNLSILGTQGTNEFVDQKIETHGKAIMNNAAYKLLMGMEKDAVDNMSKLTTLNESECDVIRQLRRGQALFIYGNKRMMIDIIATENERKEFDPYSV